MELNIYFLGFTEHCIFKKKLLVFPLTETGFEIKLNFLWQYSSFDILSVIVFHQCYNDKHPDTVQLPYVLKCAHGGLTHANIFTDINEGNRSIHTSFCLDIAALFIEVNGKALGGWRFLGTSC